MSEATATTYRIEIPGYRPPSVNQLLGAHWAIARRRKRRCYRVVGNAFLVAGVPRANTRRRLGVEIIMAGPGRLPDADNILKCLMDALVACGALRDDSPLWLQLGTVEVRRGTETRTVITLEDL